MANRQTDVRRIDWIHLEVRLRDALRSFRTDVRKGASHPFITLHQIDEIVAQETGRGYELNNMFLQSEAKVEPDLHKSVKEDI